VGADIYRVVGEKAQLQDGKFSVKIHRPYHRFSSMKANHQMLVLAFMD
jgi:hypothetical protein